MLEMAFYWSLTLTQFSDVKSKVSTACLHHILVSSVFWQDFWEMFIHQIATLALLILSWTNHMHRMGSLVLLVHDFADHWLELAKLARYANFTVSREFLIVWKFCCLFLTVVVLIGTSTVAYYRIHEVQRYLSLVCMANV